MTADDNNPYNEAHAPDPEPPQYREVSEEELKRILAEHDKWIETEGEKGSRADLSNSDLQEANLTNANLQEACFFEANLQQAYFTEANLQQAEFAGANLQEAFFDSANLQGALLADANLQNAELVDANLQNAIVIGANLRNAELAGANLQEADLSNANLTDVKSLLVGSLAGADLTNATLPEAIEKFEGLSHASETSQNARKIFLGLILGCVYSWLTIATTTDVRLLTNSASSPLPIIQTEIPIVWFYWAAPAVLLCVYFYLHLYLQRLWQGLAALPAVFPDGKPLDERAYPWLLNGLVRAHVQRLKRGRPALSRFEACISIVLAWWLVPLTLMMFWLRYLPRHDWSGTILQIALIVAAAGFGFTSYWLARTTLRGQPVMFDWRKPWREARSYLATATLLVAVAVSFVSYGAINGVRTYTHTKLTMAETRQWVPYGFSLVGYDCFATLRETDVSTKPRNWTGIALRPEQDLQKIKLLENARAELAQVKGASLQATDLRYANAAYAFLAKADLYGADLQGANLQFAILQGAVLRHATLEDVDLGGAFLKDTDFAFASLMNADLHLANLIRAELNQAKLINADLRQVDLTSANLSGANLIRANLTRANLSGANLSEANLGGVNLNGVNLTKAILGKANLNGADLSGADLSGVDLRRVFGLVQGQLDAACGDAETKLPVDFEVKRCGPDESGPKG